MLFGCPQKPHVLGPTSEISEMSSGISSKFALELICGACDFERRELVDPLDLVKGGGTISPPSEEPF